MRIVIITGISGSGKSTALHALEDSGYFCIDNLPFALLSKFLELSRSSQEAISKVAVMMDLRSRDFKDTHFSDVKKLKEQGHTVEILFMEASEEVVLRRYQTTRRKHPWPGNLSIQEAIREEKKLLAPIRKLADFTVDTSDLNVHQLRAFILKTFKKSDVGQEMQVSLYSFGYNYGIPSDADLVMDVRCLPNPFFVDRLKDLTGESPEIIEYLLSHKETQDFLNKFYELIDYLIPLYKREGKAYLTLAIGCTGGRHRSVAIATKLKEHLSSKNISLDLKHRDMSK